MEIDESRWAEFDLMIASGRFASREDVANQALTAMTWMIQHAKEGRDIVAIDYGDRCQFVLSMPFLTGLSEK